eukprot:7629600-Pyramimonas_sp.AAC.1
MEEYEPRCRSQTTGLQKVMTFAFATDVQASSDAFEKLVQQRQKASGRKVDEAERWARSSTAWRGSRASRPSGSRSTSSRTPTGWTRAGSCGARSTQVHRA